MRGPTGPPGVSGWVMVSNTSASNSNTARSVSVNCPAGKSVLGGGASTFHFAGEPLVIGNSYPENGRWVASAHESAAYAPNWSLRAYVLCANVTT